MEKSTHAPRKLAPSKRREQLERNPDCRRCGEEAECVVRTRLKRSYKMKLISLCRGCQWAMFTGYLDAKRDDEGTLWSDHVLAFLAAES